MLTDLKNEDSMNSTDVKEEQGDQIILVGNILHDFAETMSEDSKDVEIVEPRESVENSLTNITVSDVVAVKEDAKSLEEDEKFDAENENTESDPLSVDLNGDNVETLDESENEDGNDDDGEDVGNPEKPPGEDATREIDADHLLPFFHGWRREVVIRKGNEKVATQYDVCYIPPENGQWRTREAKRKRMSKTDQEKYFADFPSPVLSIKNFNYVRRPLGINNAAYEILRKGEVAKPEKEKARIAAAATANNSSDKQARRVSSYKEVEESSGLLIESDDEATDDEIVCINGFDVIAPISSQVQNAILGLRAENMKRGRRRDPQTCCTPPLAEDMLWSGLDDDPMGVYNELGGRSSPTTPPPLRAVLLTPIETAEKIQKRYSEIRELAAKRDFLREQSLEEDLASHDIAIRRFKNFKESRYPHGYVSSFNNSVKRPIVGHQNRYTSSLIMKPFFDHMKHLPGISFSQSSPSKDSFRPCSMQCPGSGGTMPDLQCVSCKRLYHPRCQNAQKQAKFRCRLCRSGTIPPESRMAPNRGDTIRMKLPMHPVNGKRPIVELVMLQNGKYQPIKFSNNVQITETIPKSMFEQANALRKTVYQKATQLPRVGSNSIYIAVNPSQRPPQQPQSLTSTSMPKMNSSSAANLSPATSEQVSILVRPQKGGKPVLLNVPRKVATKVKNGTTLSFSASSSDQKYVVISNKIHPPVKQDAPKQPNKVSSQPSSSVQPRTNFQTKNSNPGTKSGGSSLSGLLPSSVSLEPVVKSTLSVNRRRPAVSVSINRASESEPPSKLRKSSSGILSSGEILSNPIKGGLTPCSPYCPGVNGFPELECCECQSLYHLKCVGIPQTALPKIKNTFKCNMCVQRKTPSSKPATASSPNVQVIELD